MNKMWSVKVSDFIFILDSSTNSSQYEKRHLVKTLKNAKDVKETTMFFLAVGIIIALALSIGGDYLTSWFETQRTGLPQEVSSDVMKLAQTALGGLIGVLGGYFGAKASGGEESSPETVAIIGRIVMVLAIGTMTAICLAIVGDYITSAIETSVTKKPQDVSTEVMTLVQTALGGVIGIIGSYFGASE